MFIQGYMHINHEYNAEHDILNIDHKRTIAKLIFGVFKNIWFYKLC